MPDLIQDTIVVPPNSTLVGASPTRTFKDADGKHYSGTVPVALDGTPLGELLVALIAKLSSDPATQTTLAAVLSALASVPVTNANLDVALSTRTKPADQQHTIVDSIPSVVVTNGNLDVALSTRTKPSDVQSVSGTVAVTNANLDAKLSDIKAKTDNLDVALSTRTKSTDIQAVSGTVAVTSSYLDAKLSDIKALLQPLPIWSIGPVSVSGGASLDLRPAEGDEIRIENFTYDGDIELYVYDGALQLVTSFTGPNASFGYTFRSTHERYYQIKNNTAGAFLITAEGMYTLKV